MNSELVSPIHSLLSLFASFRFLKYIMYDTQCIPYVGREGLERLYGILTFQNTSGSATLSKMAASLRILAKGKLSIMQPALRAIITRTCPVILSRGLSVTSKLSSNLFVACLV